VLLVTPLADHHKRVLQERFPALGGTECDAGFNVFVRNLERLRDGRPLINLIDKSAGYSTPAGAR